MTLSTAFTHIRDNVNNWTRDLDLGASSDCETLNEFVTWHLGGRSVILLVGTVHLGTRTAELVTGVLCGAIALFPCLARDDILTIRAYVYLGEGTRLLSDLFTCTLGVIRFGAISVETEESSTTEADKSWIFREPITYIDRSIMSSENREAVWTVKAKLVARLATLVIVNVGNIVAAAITCPLTIIGLGYKDYTPRRIAEDSLKHFGDLPSEIFRTLVCILNSRIRLRDFPFHDRDFVSREIAELPQFGSANHSNLEKCIDF